LIAQDPHAFLGGLCHFFSGLVLSLMGMAGDGSAIDLRGTCLKHRGVDILPIQEDRGEPSLVVAIHLVDLDLHPRALN